MQVSFYPYTTHLVEDRFKKICSEHGGILQSLMFSPLRYVEPFEIKSVSGHMPYYHKVLLDPSLDVQYHLTGYGTFYEEAIIRLVGEAIERYSLMASQYALAHRVRYASYRQMRDCGTVVPFEYLRLFTDDDYARLRSGKFRGLRQLTEDDIVGWLACPSLFRPGEDIWVPLQVLFVGYRINARKGEIGFSPGFSTGTAAHVSIEKALLNALLERIQIDALMIHWYSMRAAPRVVPDDLTLLRLHPALFAADSPFEVVNTDLSVLEGVSAHVFGTLIVNRKDERPLITYGAQAHLDPLKGLYRSLMEAIAISFLGIYGPLYSPREYLAPLDGEDFTDLDTNVAFFAHADKAAAKRELVHRLIQGRRLLSAMPNYETGSARADLCRLIGELARHSQYAVYLDVTPPEAREKGWYVMRVYIPELLTMCVPGVPYSLHPRFAKFGGIVNDRPHPLP
jgi:thiazole/oxazole-forming peptide maturase SagD family component